MKETTARKTICLNMIVKNEAHIIADTLEHLLKFIKFDYWVISDTGSTDATKEIIVDFFKTKNIPGELDETPWKDFGYNRTVAFQRAYKKTDYVFVWDADDEIYGNFVMPAVLKHDLYKFIFGNDNGFRYSRCQMFNNHKKWMYKGVLHEYAMCTEPTGPMFDVLGDYYFISGRKGDRSKDPNKYLKDALILEKAFAEAYEAKDPLYNRYCFYCAQSYNSCNMHEKAIEYYKKALTLDLWIQERYMCCLEIYDQYELLKKPEEGLRFLVESYSYDSTRVECIYRLIKYYCINGPVDVAYMYYSLIKDFFETKYVGSNLSDKLFAKQTEYDFYLPYYMIIVGERSKHLDTCAKMFEIICKQQCIINEWWVRNFVHNCQFFIKNLPLDLTVLENFLEYIDKLRKSGVVFEGKHLEIIDKIIAHYRRTLATSTKTLTVGKRDTVRVMLTVTTCKRFDLFEQTINSMLSMWSDIDKVDYWYCVDDNSSSEDRMKMQSQYPFFNYYMKSPDEKGHRESMNIIWSKLEEIKPTYWVHMEDDWLYFKNEPYITRGINCLEKYKDQNIHQVVFNKTYGLMFTDLDRVGALPLEPGLVVHEKREGLVGKNCGYWPHYSLQPSIIRTEVILQLGNYDSANTFFERDYANKYHANGYKTAFFDSIFSLHIGKQHWEKDGQNAYSLNQVGQFKVEPKKTEAIKSEELDTTIEIMNTNEPLVGNMTDHLHLLLDKIRSGLHFGLIRPSDGEYTILKGKTLTNCDNWTFNSGGKLQQQLAEAVQTVDKNLYIGIPCNVCNKPWNCTDTIYNDFINTFKVPLAQRTYANIVGNANWPIFSEFLKGYTKGFYLITSGTKATELHIKERFIIDPLLVNNWDTEGESVTKRLLQYISNKKNQLICFSAGPLSKVWIPMCMKANPSNTYFDVGASIDIFTKGSTNRLYTDKDHPFSKEVCVFKDSLVVSAEESKRYLDVFNESISKFNVSTDIKHTNLLYFCVFHNKEYAEYLKLHLISLKYYSKLDTVDILVYTSEEFEPYIKSISNELNIPITIKIAKYNSSHEAACARLYIFDYENLDQYSKILYLDTDILVQGDLTSLFTLELDDILYAKRENVIGREHSGGTFFDFDTIDRNTPAINSGVLLFNNSQIIRSLFDEVKNHIVEMRKSGERMPHCMDQPFINYHFIKNNKYNHTLLESHVTLYSFEGSLPVQGLLAHFIESNKYPRMLQHLKNMLNNFPKTGNNNLISIINKKYSWNSGFVWFQNNNVLLTSWGKGTYTVFDNSTLNASWNGYSHILKISQTFDSYVSVNINNNEIVRGNLIA